MSGFLWSSGHLGWGLFALIVFTGLWWLAADFAWRVNNTRIGRLAAVLAGGWLVGAACIVVGFWLVGQ